MAFFSACSANRLQFLVFLGLLIVITSCSSDAPDLRLQLVKGQQLQQSTDVISRVIQVYRGDSIETLMEVKTQTQFEVNQVNDATYQLTAKHVKMAADMVARGRHFGISSEEENSDSPLSDVLAQIKNKPFRLQLNEQGRIVELAGLNDWIDKAMEQLDTYNPDEIAALREQIETSFGESIFIGNFEVASAALPDTFVAEGESWEIYSEMVTGFAGMAKVTYTLSEVTKSQYTILGTGTIFSNPEGRPAISNSMQLQYDLSGTIESVVKIDRKTGWVIDANVGQYLEGTVSMPALYEGDSEMKLPMFLENQMRITGIIR
ncbi:MAG: DUF6263 family protein [Schleiferiaceae bacterium]|nr:DUF6263 family protein [Schleiferiaceae bacterium]